MARSIFHGFLARLHGDASGPGEASRWVGVQALRGRCYRLNRYAALRCFVFAGRVWLLGAVSGTPGVLFLRRAFPEHSCDRAWAERAELRREFSYIYYLGTVRACHIPDVENMCFCMRLHCFALLMRLHTSLLQHNNTFACAFRRTQIYLIHTYVEASVSIDLLACSRMHSCCVLIARVMVCARVMGRIMHLLPRLLCLMSFLGVHGILLDCFVSCCLCCCQVRCHQVGFARLVSRASRLALSSIVASAALAGV